MIYNERNIRKEIVLEAAKQIMMAARTAPKGKGVDIIEIITLSHDSLPTLSENMRSEGKKRGMMFFLRDADNIEQALGLNCAYCGAKTCGENPESNPCAINSIDVGIAIGSACSKAADLRIDTRVMFSAGTTAQSMNLLPGCNQIIASALSVSSKNPFFDRKFQAPKQ